MLVGFTGSVLLNVYWNRQGKLKQAELPMVYYVSPDQPIEGKEAAVLGAKLWNETVGIEVIKIKIAHAPDNGFNNIYFANNQRIDMGRDRLGTTAVQGSFFPPGFITEADIYIPDFVRTFSLIESCYEKGDVEKFDLLSVVTHEMGHGLGLPHYNFKNSLMTPTMDLTYFGMIMSGKDLIEYAKPTAFDVGIIKEKYREHFNGDNAKR